MSDLSPKPVYIDGKLNPSLERGDRVAPDGLYVGQKRHIVYVAWGNGYPYTDKHQLEFKNLCDIFDGKHLAKEQEAAA